MILRGFACWMVPRAVGGSIGGSLLDHAVAGFHFFFPKKENGQKSSVSYISSYI